MPVVLHLYHAWLVHSIVIFFFKDTFDSSFTHIFIFWNMYTIRTFTTVMLCHTIETAIKLHKKVHYLYCPSFGRFGSLAKVLTWTTPATGLHTHDNVPRRIPLPRSITAYPDDYRRTSTGQEHSPLGNRPPITLQRALSVIAGNSPMVLGYLGSFQRGCLT